MRLILVTFHTSTGYIEAQVSRQQGGKEIDHFQAIIYSGLLLLFLSNVAQLQKISCTDINSIIISDIAVKTLPSITSVCTVFFLHQK